MLSTFGLPRTLEFEIVKNIGCGGISAKPDGGLGVFFAFARGGDPCWTGLSCSCGIVRQKYEDSQFNNMEFDGAKWIKDVMTPIQMCMEIIVRYSGVAGTKDPNSWWWLATTAIFSTANEGHRRTVLEPSYTAVLLGCHWIHGAKTRRRMMSIVHMEQKWAVKSKFTQLRIPTNHI